MTGRRSRWSPPRRRCTSCSRADPITGGTEHRISPRDRRPGDVPSQTIRRPARSHVSACADQLGDPRWDRSWGILHRSVDPRATSDPASMLELSVPGATRAPLHHAFPKHPREGGSSGPSSHRRSGLRPSGMNRHHGFFFGDLSVSSLRVHKVRFDDRDLQGCRLQLDRVPVRDGEAVPRLTDRDLSGHVPAMSVAPGSQANVPSEGSVERPGLAASHRGDCAADLPPLAVADRPVTRPVIFRVGLRRNGRTMIGSPTRRTPREPARCDGRTSSGCPW